MNRTTANIEAAAKCLRIYLDNHECGDLPGRVSENGVKTRIAKRDWADEAEKTYIDTIEIKTNICGEGWEWDRKLPSVEVECKRLAKMFGCSLWFEDFGNGWRNRIEVRLYQD